MPDLRALYDSDPKRIDALFDSVRELCDEGRFDLAEPLLIRFSIELPEYDHGIAFYELAGLLEEKGDISGAEAAYRNALSYEPMFQVYLEAFAYFLWRRGSESEAVSVMRILRSGTAYGNLNPDRYDRFLAAIDRKISYDDFVEEEGPEWWT